MCAGDFNKQIRKSIDQKIITLESKRKTIDKRIEALKLSKLEFEGSIDEVEIHSLNKEQEIRTEATIDVATNKYAKCTAKQAIMDVISSHENKDKLWKARELNDILIANGLVRKNISADMGALAAKGNLQKIREDGVLAVSYKLP